jgi:hypothetical protein
MSDSGLTKVGLGWNVTFSPAPGASNHCSVTIQVKDNDGNNIDEAIGLVVWLSDEPDGSDLTNTAISGSALAAATGGGTLLGQLTAKKAAYVVTNNDGAFILDIEDSAKTAFYVCAVVPGQPGRIAVSDVLATADYA